MKQEFKRFGLEKFGLMVVIFEILGAAGLLVGLLYNPILILSSAGLALLMIFGLIVRLRLKDSVWISLPASFFVVLNVYILQAAISY